MSDDSLSKVIPKYNLEVIDTIQVFVVEELRTARRFLKSCGIQRNIDDLLFFELNEHTDNSNLDNFLTPLQRGQDVGVLSEAGCPAIADPGAHLVKLAHEKGINVVPLVGPTSIILALMSSGMNGQNFAFNGYLPVKDGRNKAIKSLEQLSKQKNQTQIFIEAPYRNQKLLEDLLSTCHGDTLLCIGVDITGSSESIVTKTIRDWKKHIPDINKKPSIFLLHCY